LRPLAASGAITDPSLASGSAGVALLFLERSAAAGGGKDAERGPEPVAATALLDHAVGAADASDLSVSLFSGLVGTGYALAIADRLDGDHSGDDSGGLADDEPDDLDQLVARVLALDEWPGSFDLMRGLVGIGVFCLARRPKPSADAALARVVEHLERIAEPVGSSSTWRTRPEGLPLERAEQFPDGYFDTGLSHGVAGVVAFLAAAAEAGVPNAAGLRDRGLNWLLDQRLATGGPTGDYPLLRGPDDEPTGGRLAWCYGDAGLAVALLAAGADDEGTRLAMVAARRTDASSGVVDAGLCHGSAGLGHVFNRLAQRTSSDEVASAARRWLADALARRTAATAAAGFTAVLPDGKGGRVEVPTIGLLEGAAGIALALQSAVASSQPEWDAAFLLR
jgi:lantibiotic modifying enzyme